MAPESGAIRRFSAGSSVALAARPIGDVSPRGHEAFSHQLATTVGVILVIVPIAMVSVTIPRAHPKSEWPDLHAGATGAAAHIELRGSRHSREHRSRRQRGQ